MDGIRARYAERAGEAETTLTWVYLSQPTRKDGLLYLLIVLGLLQPSFSLTSRMVISQPLETVKAAGTTWMAWKNLLSKASYCSLVKTNNWYVNHFTSSFIPFAEL
jgi:hypothetical protein